MLSEFAKLSNKIYGLIFQQSEIGEAVNCTLELMNITIQEQAAYLVFLRIYKLNKGADQFENQ